MAKKPRIHFPGAVYHIILTGNSHQPLFFSDEDRMYFYGLLEQGVGRFGHRVHAYCLMGNHVHLVVQVGEQPLGKIFHLCCLRYAKWVNKRMGRTGHLFQGPYYASLVDVNSYLLELVRYVHLNPVRAGLTDEPAGYPWSSYRAYLGEEELPWLTTDWVLRMFHPDRKRARRSFEAFVWQNGRKRDGWKEDGLPVQGDFTSQLTGRTLPERLLQPSLEGVIKAVCRSYGLQVRQLRAPGKRRAVSEARAAAAALVWESQSLSLTELGRALGRDTSTLSRSVLRHLDRVDRDRGVAQRFQSLRERLAPGGS
jgi:REP element-mobilizing transposase RayT